MSSKASLVCLLPARNAAGDLPGYLRSAARLCDAIVALDDGSTDDTRELLQASPLVKVLLTNPRREGYRGWKDGENRNRLLRAAAELEPEWILWIDADERMDAGDAAALREFVRRDALPGCVYGFEHYWMWGRRRYDPRCSWIFRLFDYEPGQTLPRRRLHFNPVPTGIPPRAWIRTTIRVQHLGVATEERRLGRLAKYREADPRGRYGTDLSALSRKPPGDLPVWRRRPPGLPVLIVPEDTPAQAR